MTLDQIKMQINQKRWTLEDTELYRLLTLGVQAIEKLEDRISKEEVEEIEIIA